MELCDSVQLDPEKDNSWEGVNQEDTDGLTFLFWYFFLLVAMGNVIQMIVVKL